MSEKDNLTGKELGLTSVRGRMLTVKEVASFLRVSERWVQVHMQKGTFPIRWYLISERDRVVDSVDLNDWLRNTVINAGDALLPLKTVKKHLKEVSA